ncbi:MAG: hypothetical protein WC822_01805 [Candidatus Paceibacterota bacterium]|jgi:hypothetical protein
MKKNILSILILVFGISTSGVIISLANAQTEPLLQPQEQKMPGDIQYPIPELGNCTSKSNCKTFCDNSKNSDVCLSFAEQRNLMTPDELSNAKKFKDNGMVGPGGCKGQTACEQYCGASTHLEECIAFAEKNGMMPEQQLKDSKKVIAAIKSGLKPPACGGSEQCTSYCSNPQHMEECMTFSIAAGIVPDNQKEQMQKTLSAIKQGAKPPACQPNPPSDQLGQSGQTNQSNSGLPMCDKYCGTHQEECMTFSLATGMVPDDQKMQMQKALDVFKQGIKPPACQPNPPDQSGQPNQPNQSGQSGGAGGPNEGLKNKSNQSSKSEQDLQACDQYCADSSHVEECVKFSVAIGNMTEEQGQNSIRNGGKGPGGCVGRDACNTFCDNPDNQETCFNFGKDNGMIPKEDLQRMQDGQQKMKDSFSQIPQEVLDCLTSTVGADVVEKMKNGSFVPKNAGDSINQCFQKAPQGKMPDQNQLGQPGQNQSGDNQPKPGNINSGGEQMPPGQNQPGQPGENQPINQMQPGQLFREKIEPNKPEPSDQLNQMQLNQLNQLNQPSQQPGQFIESQPGEPGQIQQPQEQIQPQIQQQENIPPPPTSFLQGVHNFLANVLSAFK